MKASDSSFIPHPSALLLGAGDEIRTRDPQLGRLMLYQLSYTRPRISDCGFRIAEFDPPRDKSEIHIQKSEITTGAGGRIRTYVRR